MTLGGDRSMIRWWPAGARSARLAGAPIPVVDGLIAATAARHGLTVATRNIADFARGGVEVVDPWTADPDGAGRG